MASQDDRIFLDGVEGEIALFKALTRARPIGTHRHFHILAIQILISKETGKLLPATALWEKLERCYNLEALEAIVNRIGFLLPDSILITTFHTGARS
jgi:MRG-binding protein